MKISDLILMSDVDGTLLVHSEEIPQRNIDALQRFTKGGGRFGIATGRSVLYAKDVANRVSVNFPCVVLNGGGIYDYSTGDYLMEIFLPEAAKEYVCEIMDAFPGVRALVVDKNNYHDVTVEMAISQSSRQNQFNKHIVPGRIDSLTGAWYKAILFVDDGQAEMLRGFVAKRGYQGIHFVYSGHTMFEMMPDEVSKGTAIKELMRLKGVDSRQLVAIGDYDNDLEMIGAAGFGVAVGDAPKHVRERAQMIVGPGETGAVADLIEYLEHTYGY